MDVSGNFRAALRIVVVDAATIPRSFVDGRSGVLRKLCQLQIRNALSQLLVCGIHGFNGVQCFDDGVSSTTAPGGVVVDGSRHRVVLCLLCFEKW